MNDSELQKRPAPATVGSPRVTVAFPFSKIEIREPEPHLADLTDLVCQLAEELAAVCRKVAEDKGEAAEHLVDELNRLAARVGVR